MIAFPLEGFSIVEKEPIVDGIRPVFKILVLVAMVRCFLLQNFLQPKKRWIFRESNCFRLSHGAGIDDGGIGGRLVASL